MRSYLRISPDLIQQKEQDGYGPSAIAGYVALLCAGAKQNPAGNFANLLVLRGHLGQHQRWIRFMVDQNDLEKREDGTYYIHGWDEWQEGNWQVAERMKRVREARKNRNGGDGANRNGHENAVTGLFLSSSLSTSSVEEGDAEEIKRVRQRAASGELVKRATAGMKSL